MSEKQTLQEELEAEFPKHQIGHGGQEGGWCTCGWTGRSADKHLVEIATRITNARVEGLIRDAAEAGFKMREDTYGPVEYGVVYPMLIGGEPDRVMSSPYAEQNTKEEAEGHLKYWRDKGQKAYLLVRQWRRI